MGRQDNAYGRPNLTTPAAGSGHTQPEIRLDDAENDLQHAPRAATNCLLVCLERMVRA